jgi:hypothetical protein
MEGIDRQALLEEAAERLDALRGPMGKDPRNVKSAVGKTLRAFKEDEAYVSFPEVYKIIDKDFLSQSRQVPVPFKQLARDYDFYWMRFPIFLRRKRN